MVEEKFSHLEEFKFSKFITFPQLFFPEMIKLFNFLFNTLAKDEDEIENKIADEFAEEDLPQNDVEQKQGQNDPWGRRRRRRRRRKSRGGWGKYIDGAAALLGNEMNERGNEMNERDEPGFKKADE